MTKKQIITVQNAEGDISTQAEILIQNKIDYTPKVSVIIPVYNVEQYLHECLDSVVNQTLKEIEIICIDDGSTDSSLEILKEYAKKDNRITVITQKNLHAGVARNAGLSVAKGEYLSFLDSDDFFELNMLEETYNNAKKNNSDIVIFRYNKYDCRTKKVSKNLGANENFLKIDKIIKPIDLKTFNITCPMPWNKLFNRFFVLNKNLKFSSTKVCNDVFFVLAGISVANKVSYCNKSLLFYRIFQKNSLSASREQNKFTFLKAYLDLKIFLENNNIFTIFRKVFFEDLYNAINWTASQQNDKDYFYRELFNQNVAKKLQIISMKDLKFKARSDLYISLTSYPKRIPAIHKTIETLLNQTMKADKVILWLAPEQFPNGEADLPQQLLDLKEKGLTIDWYHDIRSYKKLIPALKKYPDAIIVTADDDILYPENWLELLFLGYEEYPNMINCHRSFRISVKDKQKILPYTSWNRGMYIPRKGTYGQTWNNAKVGFRNFYTSGSGALYPPHLLHSDIFNEKLFKQLAPTEDDIWYWSMAVRKGTKIHVVKNNLGLMDGNIDSDQSEALYNINSQNNTTNKIFENIFTYFSDVKTRVIEDSDVIIISLTSYPARINTVNQVIETLLNQTMKADKVILWLAPEQFPNGEADLPQQLLDLKEKGLTIDWYHDIRSYKKLIPALKKYPDAIIVTADDDILYPENWLERLYDGYSKNPNCICAHRAHLIKLVNGKLIYNNFIHSDSLDDKQYKGYFLLACGCGGILYPPNSLDKNVLDLDKAEKLCYDCDDIWFWLNAIKNKTQICLIDKRIKYISSSKYMLKSVQEFALYKKNVFGGNNDVCLKNILKRYPEILKILKKNFPRRSLFDFIIKKSISGIKTKRSFFGIPLYKSDKQPYADWTAKFYLFGIPTYIIRQKGNVKRHSLFNFFPLYKRDKSSNTEWTKKFYVFGIPTYIVRLKNGIKRYSLFNFIPLYKRQRIGNNYVKKFYLFGLQTLVLRKQNGKRIAKIFGLSFAYEHIGATYKVWIFGIKFQHTNKYKNLLLQLHAFQSSVKTDLKEVEKRLRASTEEGLSSVKTDSIDKQNIALKSMEKTLSSVRSDISLQSKDFLKANDLSQRYYKELNFADLLHDSTKDSKWLKDKSFALYGWAANYSFIYTLFRVLDNAKPLNILEMGMGQSSKVTTQYMVNFNKNGLLDIIENDKNWIDVYYHQLVKSDNVHIHQCDLEFFDYNGVNCRKYKELDKVVNNKKYNFIIVDGPWGGCQTLPRSNILDLIDNKNLAEDFIIIFDDAERTGEQETIKQTIKKLKSLQIDFVESYRSALKKQCLIMSKSFEFVKFL